MGNCQVSWQVNNGYIPLNDVDIQISEPRLDELPDNGVPNEIMESTRHSDEVEHLWSSMAGYVDEEEGVVDDMDATRCVEGV